MYNYENFVKPAKEIIETFDYVYGWNVNLPRISEPDEKPVIYLWLKDDATEREIEALQLQLHLAFNCYEFDTTVFVGIECNTRQYFISNDEIESRAIENLTGTVVDGIISEISFNAKTMSGDFPLFETDKFSGYPDYRLTRVVSIFDRKEVAYL